MQECDPTVAAPCSARRPSAKQGLLGFAVTALLACSSSPNLNGEPTGESGESAAIGVVPVAGVGVAETSSTARGTTTAGSSAPSAPQSGAATSGISPLPAGRGSGSGAASPGSIRGAANGGGMFGAGRSGGSAGIPSPNDGAVAGTSAQTNSGSAGAAGVPAANGGGSGTSAGDGNGGETMVCPPGITRTITVAKDGTGQFTSVQAAINSIASGSSASIRIDIGAGTYTEKLTIANRTNLCLVGAGATETILSYGDSNAKVGSTSGSASVLISANDFSAANLTFQNTYGPGSQAVAVRTTGQRQQFLNCRFVGYQDTLYTHQGTQYFKGCYVQGNTDYVFGGATAVLEGCEVRNVEGGSATTAPNTEANTTYGIVFLRGKFTAAASVRAKSVGLARPWGAAGFAAFIDADLGAHIVPEGFVPMSGNQPGNARFHEFQSTGPGANTSGRSAYQLTTQQAEAYTLANLLPGWTPSYAAGP